MFGSVARSIALLASAASLFSSSVAASELDAHSLPIFFFHGILSNATYGNNLKQNLSTDARPLVPLSFCEEMCTFIDLHQQTQLAIAQIRSIVASDSRFANGYSFVAHSQGSAIARSVIEEMDDHQVHTFISLAGAANGIFYGPQESDFVPAMRFLNAYAPLLLQPPLFDSSAYGEADIASGRFSIDTTKLQMAVPALQDAGAAFQLNRSPVITSWLSYSSFFPVVNNVKMAENEAEQKNQERRKNNFLKLKAAHYFGSSYDETISPWQTSILGRYSEVESIEELEATYQNLTIVSVKETIEYQLDTYGLRTLDERGGLSLHIFDKVSHSCWIEDSEPIGRPDKCFFQPVFEQSVYPLLQPLE